MAGGCSHPVATCPVKAYFPRMSANLLLMEANSSRCASASFSQIAILFSETLRPGERPAELLLVECHLGLPLLSWTARIAARSTGRPMKSALASGVDLGRRCRLTLRTGPAGGVNNSGGRCVAGAASESLKLASITVSGMRRSPAQVRVLATYEAGHTIIEPEHSTAGPAFTAGVRRAISSGMLSIETAHFLTSVRCVLRQDTGRLRGLAARSNHCLNWCIAQIFVDYFINRTRNGLRGLGPGGCYALPRGQPVAPAISTRPLPTLRA
jgi:hypothetical protein